MTDRPILFSAPMINAMLAGRKTQTRRLIATTSADMAPGQIMLVEGPRFGGTAYRFAPRFTEGDRLYAREEWKVGKKWDAIKPSLLPPRTMTVLYGAGGESCTHLADEVWREQLNPPEGTPDWAGRRRPGMHMPRWASRLTLIVEAVRVERLQVISDADAEAEGVTCWVCGGRVDGTSEEECACFHSRSAAVPSYQVLWNGLHDKPGERWDDNPFVVAVSFRVVRGNIDQVPA